MSQINYFDYLYKLIDQYETEIRAGLELCMDKYLAANPKLASVEINTYQDYDDNGYSAYRSIGVQIVDGYEDESLPGPYGTGLWSIEESITEDLEQSLPNADLLTCIFGSGWSKTWKNPHALEPKETEEV